MKIWKRSGFTALEAIVVLGLAAPLLIPVAIPVFSRVGENGQRATCQQNLKQIALATMQYTMDYDEQLPRVSVHNVSTNTPPYYNKVYGWADAIQPYMKNIQIYQCPSDKRPPNPKGDAVKANFIDYWYNSNLSGRSMADMTRPAEIVLHGDGNDGSDMTNARYSKQQLPKAWLTNSNSPLNRHLMGANISWLDGHVKWYKPQQIANYRGRANTLSVK